MSTVRPKLEDNLKFVANGRRPHFLENGRQPQLFGKMEAISTFHENGRQPQF